MKNTMRCLGIIAFVTVIGFSMVACDTGNGGGGGGGNGNGGGSNSGWPNASILTEYGLSGMAAPAGATNISYGIATVGGNSLTIYFTGSSANDSPITNWFTGHGWTEDGTYGDGTSVVTYMYSKAGFDQASYTRTNGTNCQIQVVKN